MSPRTFVRATALVALTALVAAARPAEAQRRRHRSDPWERRSGPTLSLGGSAVFSSVGANSRDARIGDGVGYDVNAGVGVSALTLGVGYQRTEHDFAGVTPKAVYSTTYLEPRVTLDLGAGNFTPYLSARVGRTRLRLPDVPSTAAGTFNATSYGAGGGVHVWLARSVALDLGALWSRLDYARGGSPSEVYENGENGVTFRAGLRLTP
jgi:opacity protein-like surface antigen